MPVLLQFRAGFRRAALKLPKDGNKQRFLVIITGIDGLARQPRCLDDSIHRHTIAMLQEHLHSHVQYSPVDLRRSFKTGAAGPLMVWLQQYPLSLLSTILSFFSSSAKDRKSTRLNSSH